MKGEREEKGGQVRKRDERLMRSNSLAQNLTLQVGVATRSRAS